jgi:hypothetical protein
MEWNAQVDGYCERLSPGFWAEPINAVTNLAFVFVGLWMLSRSRGVAPAQYLSLVLIVIGIGSGLFHTLATRWAGVADVVPIVVFVLSYIYCANRYFWRASTLWSGIGVLLFFPYAAVLVPLAAQVPGVGSSAAYVPVPILIAAYGILLWRRLPQVGRGLVIGAAGLTLSIPLRSLDEPLCAQLPMGTHFLWHILNAVMLGWMIEVLRRHLGAGVLAGGGQGR